MDTPSKDEKALPMFTPKNSDGSQRVIKQIMVIDPNKLRVAGLDLKMAEALKKSKWSRGNTNSNRTKDDKLALAKTILNRKLKQVKFAKETQNQNVTKEKSPSPQKMQTNAVALQTLLSSPQTFITPSPKQSHTMLVNILESDQRAGSIELTISNKPHVPREKPTTEQIPKASIKMTKPIKSKDATPKCIESMIISPEVKFEVKRKSLQPTSKRDCTDDQSILPRVIESKVLSPEEKVDMKTLCGNSTKPVPATVKIEITKQEIVQRKTPALEGAVSVQDKPREYVIATAPKVTSDKCLQPSPKPLPRKNKTQLPAPSEESAVDFINSLQIDITTKCESKATTEPKVDSSGVQEDATSFLMSLFEQQPFTQTLPREVTEKAENKATTTAEKPAIRNEPENKTRPERDSMTSGLRRNLKPVPVIKHKPRFSGTNKVVKADKDDSSDALEVSITPVLDKSKDGVSSTDPKGACLSSTIEEEISVREAQSKSIKIPKREEVTSSCSALNLEGEESLRKTILKEPGQIKVAEDLITILVAEESEKCSGESVTKKAYQKFSAKICSNDLGTEAVETVPVTPEEVDKQSFKKDKSNCLDKELQIVKDSAAVVVEEAAAKVVVKVPVEEEASAEMVIEKSVPEDPSCDSLPNVDVNKIENLEIGNIPLDVPIKCPETIQQTPTQDDNLQPERPKVEAKPSAPPPTTRRKGKKSVPIIVAKLKRSRKPASSQEPPKEQDTQALLVADKPLSTSDDTKTKTEDSSANSQSPLKLDEPTKVTEAMDEKKEDKEASQPNKEVEVETALQLTSKTEENIISKQPGVQEVTSETSPCNPCETVTTIDSEEAGGKPETVKKIHSKDSLTKSQSETSCMQDSRDETRNEVIVKEDSVEIDSRPAPEPISIASNDMMGEKLQEELISENLPQPIELPNECRTEDKQSISPKRKSEGQESTAPVQKKVAEKYKKDKKTTVGVGEEMTCLSKTVLCTESNTRPTSRVRKKSLELKQHMAEEVTATDVQKSEEAESADEKQAYTEYLALSIVESPKVESPKGKPEKKKACTPKKGDSPKELQTENTDNASVSGEKAAGSDKFDMIREKQIVENQSSLLPADVSKEKEDESEDFDHHDSEFTVSFQDDTEFGDTADLVKSSLPSEAIDFDSLKSADKISSEIARKPLYESKEDLDFLGFNEKEIEEGQQSTSLRLSQSEDVSPLKSSQQVETPSRKKVTSPMKKTPLSAGKKQKAEQKNWKKNSAKSLQNWLKSSTDKETSGKEEEKRKESPQKPDNTKQASAEDKEVCNDQKEETVQHVKNEATTKANTPTRGKKKKGKQDEVVDKNTKAKKSSRKSIKTEEVAGALKEPISNQSNTEDDSQTSAIDTKTTNKAAAKGQKKKSQKEALQVAASSADEAKPSRKSTKNDTLLDEQLLKVERESAEIKSPSGSIMQEQKKKSKRGSLAKKPSLAEEESVATLEKNIELDNSLVNTSKRKLETEAEISSKDHTESNTPTTPAPRQKRKYTRRSITSEPATPTEKTPKSNRKNTKQLTAEKELLQMVKSEVDLQHSDDLTTSLIEPNPRKRKALKCEAETPNKVAHVSAESDHEFSTPKQRGTKELQNSDAVEIVIRPKSGKKYKHSSEFNPRLLLIRTKEELKSDAPLVDPTLQAVPKSKDDVQCGFCKGYTPKKKWTQHVSEHYGVGWIAGSAPPLNITCRSAVLNYMIDFFKSSKVKGLNCRLCQGLRRSALGLLSHVEQCCLTEEEIKESRVQCEHCKKEYSKASLPSHLRSCSELWKKNKIINEPKTEDADESQEVVLSNTGRLKRKSVIKAEHKFKDMDKSEISPEELIKHIPQPRKDNWIPTWQRDIKSFGKGFCIERKCQFTSDVVEELQQHCQLGVCPHFLQPGYFCMRCKFHSDNMEVTRKHVLEKHILKPSEDFQDSEDDAVISQGSSSEDGSSGDEEVSDAEHDGGEKRKSKKKPNSAKKKVSVPVKRNSSLRDIRKLVPAQGQKIPTEVARLHQEFMKLNYSEKPLFTYAAPNVAQILDDDIEPYFSKSTVSPRFILKGFKTPFVEKFGKTHVEPDKWQQLQRLSGMTSASEHVMYLGGPVKSIAWVPMIHTSSAYQYLASVTRKEPNKFSRFLQPKQSRSLVYIHRYQIDKTDPKNIVGEICYALAIDDGPVHCIEFLPSGGYDPETNRLGLLAVGTVTSEVKVYSLPLNVQKRNCDMFPILYIEPSFVLVLELNKNEVESSDCHKSQCVSIMWSQFAGHNHIIAGYINGFVSIWDIDDDEDNLNRFLVNGLRTFVPISYFWSKDERINRVTAHYDMDGLRWLVVCNSPRRLVFYDVRDLTKPVQMMDEKTKNDCNAIDWPVVWANPAFALGDAMPTHGSCLNSISPSAIAYISKKFEKFCCGVTDLHFNPWNNMFAAGSENGDIQISPLRDTVLDVGFRRKKDEKILSSLDIVPLNGDGINENLIQSSRLLETDYSDKFGIVFGKIRPVIGVKTPELYNPKRVPPLDLTRLTRVHKVRFNHNQKTNTFLAVGYTNGLVRVLMDKWEDPLKANT